MSERAIIDLMDKSKASAVQEFTGGSNEAGGWLTNHVCFSMDREDYDALSRRLEEHGLELRPVGSGGAFGAQGDAEVSAYFSDPDGNVFEMRHYGP